MAAKALSEIGVTRKLGSQDNSYGLISGRVTVTIIWERSTTHTLRVENYKFR